MPVRTRIISIGNAQGVRIPKPLLDQAGLSGEGERAVKDNRIIIQRAEQVRSGWEEAFRAMAAEGDDELLDEPLSTEWDETEGQ